MNAKAKRQLLIDRVGPVTVQTFDGGQTLVVTTGDGHRERFTHYWGDDESSAEDAALVHFGVVTEPEPMGDWEPRS